MTKKLTLCQQNQLLINSFVHNLKTLNYAEGTYINAQLNIFHYLLWIEKSKIDLNENSTQTVKFYFEKLETQPNQKTGNGLSNSYFEKIRSSLQLFYTYLILTQVKKPQMPGFPKFKKVKYKITILTKTEVQILLNSCDQTLLGKRNKTLLALYYACGLRRQEATNLNIEDVDLKQKTVFIARSKTHQQRSVFLSDNIKIVLEDYVFNVREKLIGKHMTEGAFFLTEHGNRLSVESAVSIFKKAILESKNLKIIAKKPSLHTLRHSIATHLLQAGMKFENIALFLGHRSLDSTQIYTHLAEENN